MFTVKPSLASVEWFTANVYVKVNQTVKGQFTPQKYPLFLFPALLFFFQGDSFGLKFGQFLKTSAVEIRA